MFNIYESKISKEKLAKYSGTYTWVNSVISVIIPLVFGSIMSFRGFSKCTLIVLVLVFIKIVFSLLYKDKVISKEEKTDLKSYFPLIKKNKNLFTSYMWNFTNGLTYSGAFSSLITIYIIKQFQTGFSLGVITSILSILTSIASFIFANFIKSKSYKKILLVCYITTIISLILMVLKCNTITIIIFNFIQSFAKTYANLIDWNNCLVISNLYKEKKEEFFVTNEIFIFAGRFISYLVFCLLAFANTSLKTNIVMMLFIAFLLLRGIYSIRLQRITESK